jgi:hypothetical protein
MLIIPITPIRVTRPLPLFTDGLLDVRGGVIVLYNVHVIQHSVEVWIHTVDRTPSQLRLNAAVLPRPNLSKVKHLVKARILVEKVGLPLPISAITASKGDMPTALLQFTPNHGYGGEIAYPSEPSQQNLLHG